MGGPLDSFMDLVILQDQRTGTWQHNLRVNLIYTTTLVSLSRTTLHENRAEETPKADRQQICARNELEKPSMLLLSKILLASSELLLTNSVVVFLNL